MPSPEFKHSTNEAQVYVSHTEPQKFHHLGTPCTIPEFFGCDFLLSTNNKTIGIQRKSFPEDLLSSLPPSNRLSEQIMKMQTLTYRLIILEGDGKYTSEGKLLRKSYGGRSLTRADINSIIIALQISHSIPVIYTQDENGTIDAIQRFFRWGEKSSHGSLISRSGTGFKQPLEVHRLNIMMSLPGVGIELAKRVLEHCGGLPMILTRDLTEIRGFGKEKSELIRSVFTNG